MAEENREVWLDALLKEEGGYANNPADKGGPTNRGVTIPTLSDWRGETCNIEDITQLKEDEARNIYMARYWQVMRGDQLPSGIDLYAADFAVNSGPARAARILQELVATPADSFVGPLTIEAIRKREPAKLLDAYHDARMDFLLKLESWDTFGRGWTNRCRVMLAMAKARLQDSPMMAEAVGSKIVVANAPTAVVSAGGVAWAVQQYGPAVLDWVKTQAGNPDTLEKLQTGVAYVGHANPSTITTVLGGLLALNTLVMGYSIWRRVKMWRKGKV